MKINIVYLLLIALLGITVSASIAQQNQNVPKTDTEVESLQNSKFNFRLWKMRRWIQKRNSLKQMRNKLMQNRNGFW